MSRKVITVPQTHNVAAILGQAVGGTATTFLRAAQFSAESTTTRLWYFRCLPFVIFGISFLLRSFRMYPEFYSSDMGALADAILDAVPDRGQGILSIVPHWGSNLGNPLRLFAYDYSPLSAVLTFANVILASLLQVNLTEYVWAIPTIVIGSLTPILCYYLVLRLTGDRRAALIGALFILLFPFHVLQSRFFAVNEVLAFFGQTLVLFLLTGYAQDRTRLKAFWLGLSLAFYLFMHLQWLGMLPAVVYAAFVLAGDERAPGARARRALSLLVRREVIIPPAAAVLLLAGVSAFAARGSERIFAGPLGHVLGKAGATAIGWYGDYYWNWFLSGSGILLGITMIVCLIIGAVRVPHLSRGFILWFWALCYILPYVFYVSPQVTVPQTYYGPGFQALALFSAVTISTFLFKRHRAVGVLLVVGILLSSVYATLVTAYGYQGISAFGLSTWQGSYNSPIGLKAAGYWLRKNTSPEARVFFFDHGGMGMEPNNSFYYSGRTLMALYDSPDLEYTLAYLKRFAAEMDFLVVRDRDLAGIRDYAELLFPHYVAGVESESGRALLWIMSKEDTGRVDILLESGSSAAFDREYANLDQLSGLTRYSAKTGNPYAPYYNARWSGS